MKRTLLFLFALELAGYGTAARDSVPALRELIVELNDQCKRGEFPKGALNNRRVTAVEEAIKAIEAATAQPELRSLAAKPGGAGRPECSVIAIPEPTHQSLLPLRPRRAGW